jgi:hypothetical protein
MRLRRAGHGETSPVKIAVPASLSPHYLGRLQAVAELSDRELDALVEQATVDAYDEYEQLTSFTS